MRNYLLGSAAVALWLVCVNPTFADERHRHRSHRRGNDIHNRHASRYGHFDYSPGHWHRHGNHHHYVPPHYDYHYRGRRYDATPTPWGWQVAPWSHRRV